MGIYFFTILFLGATSAFCCPTGDFRAAEPQDMLGADFENVWEVEKNSWVFDEETLSPLVTGEKRDLISNEVFENFVLTFDFFFTPGANSGIKYLIQDEYGNIGLEFQILDDFLHPDGQKGVERRLGSLYDLIPRQTRPILKKNSFNTGCIIFKDRKGEHWLNGKKLLSYDLDSSSFKSAFAKSKFKSFSWFGSFHKGKILIQHHGDLVYFRNMRIRSILP